MRRIAAFLLLGLVALGLSAQPALSQSTVLQAGPWAQGHAPMYAVGGGSQPVVVDSGAAGGGGAGVGLSELNVTARGTGTAPFAGQGTGPLGTVFAIQDAPTTNAAGGHYLAFSANAQGGGLLAFGPFGTATALPFQFYVNGSFYQFPFVTGGIVGPSTTVVDNGVCWNNTTGTLVKTCTGAAPLTIGGTNGQIQYNAAGALGGFTASGDAAINTGTGAVTVSKIGGVNATLGGALTTAAAFSTVGSNALILTTTGATNVTLPTTGTLATLAGSEALTNKTVNGLTLTPSTGTLTIVNGKVGTFSNTTNIAGTDGSTLNIGTGGTLGTAAFTAASAYTPSTAPFQVAPYISPDTSFTNGSSTTLAHGLSSARLLTKLELVCQSNDSGYTAGQVVVRGAGEDQSNVGVVWTVDATNIVVNIGNSGVAVVNPSGFGTPAVDPTKWKLRVTAFKY